MQVCKATALDIAVKVILTVFSVGCKIILFTMQTYRKKQKQKIIFTIVSGMTPVNVSRMSPKTIANLTTYSRKPGDYNGTIIFEIDMKNSSPLNLKFTFFATVKTKITLFSAGLTALSAQLLSVTE